MADGQRKSIFDDVTPAEQAAVERIQLVGVMVVIAGIIGAKIFDRLLHVNAWLNVGIVLTVFALTVIIVTVLVARVLGANWLTVAQESLRSVGNDARQTLSRVRGRFRR